MIDFHCHIDLFPDPRAVIRELAGSCDFVLSVTTTPSAFSVTAELGKATPKIETAIGIHPELVSQRYLELSLFDQFLEETVFVGEIGLDGSPQFKRTWDKQTAVFDSILFSCSKAGGKIISIHSRRASAEVCARLASHPHCGTPILHWFSGSLADLRMAIDLGCYFSVGSPMIHSKTGTRVIQEIPQNRLLTETDGPFVTIGGKGATPGDVGLVLHGIAESWGVTPKEAESQIAANANSIFEQHGLERRIPT